MKSNEIILGVIPARGGSRGVIKKNLRPLCGKPLIVYAIECGLNCRSIDHLLVSTDDHEIAEVAKRNGAEVPFLRPSELATDTTPTLPVLQHAVIEAEKVYSKRVRCVVLLEPTGPLKTEEDVEAALKIFREGDCNAVVSGNVAHRNPYFSMVEMRDGYVHLSKEPLMSVGRRQDTPGVYDLNPIVWIYSRKALFEERARIPNRTRIYLVPPERAFDLDTEFDFELMEYMMRSRRADSVR